MGRIVAGIGEKQDRANCSFSVGAVCGKAGFWILWYICLRFLTRTSIFCVPSRSLPVFDGPAAPLFRRPSGAACQFWIEMPERVRWRPVRAFASSYVRKCRIRAVERRWSAALYTSGDSSPFRHSSWRTADFIAPLVTPSVAPGKYRLGFFFVKGAGPAERIARISSWGTAGISGSKGSRTTVRLSCPERRSRPRLLPSGSAASAASVLFEPDSSHFRPVASSIASGFKAELVDRGGIEWQLEPLARATIRVKFRNAGTATSGEYRRRSGVAWADGRKKSDFQDEGWKSWGVAAVLQETRVAPGGIRTFVVTLRGATKPGTFNEAFSLFSGTSVFRGGKRLFQSG